MSLFQSISVNCPNCGKSVTMEAVGSVNADRRPDLREDILADRFQDTTCSACGETFRLQPDFNYLDFGRGQWVAAKPADEMPDFPEVEQQVEELWQQSYGSEALPSAQELGAELTPRLTFGWPALREKILAREHGLDDVILEMTKLDLLRRVPEAPLTATTDLRLDEVTQDTLGFVWLDRGTETLQQKLSVNRRSYDAIAANPEAWSAVRNRMGTGPFIDMQRAFFDRVE